MARRRLHGDAEDLARLGLLDLEQRDEVPRPKMWSDAVAVEFP